jgi:hypothetical protein
MSRKPPPMNQQVGYGGFGQPGGWTAGPHVRRAPMQIPSGPRTVKGTQFWFLNQEVPFDGTSGQTVQTGTFEQSFPMEIWQGWTDLTGARVQFSQSNTGDFLSQFPVTLLDYAGNSDKVYPHVLWRKPLSLPARSQLRGSFINDGAEQAGNVVFWCRRPDITFDIEITGETREFRLLLDLGLEAATATGHVETQSIEFDLLIWGMTTTATSDLTANFKDTSQNVQWAADQLPIGAFAGFQGEIQPIIWYPLPWYLPRNSTIRCDFTNGGEEDGKFITLICERLLMPARVK